MAYFPQTVLTGAIGAIGLSLFILALGLTLPSSSPDLSLGNARSVLFNDTHLPLLAASFIPALFLSFSIRFQSLKRWTREMVQSDYYIPTYLFCIPIFFWIVAGATHVSKDSLVDSGWLFQVAASESQPGTGIGDTWNYWKDFNFSLVEWRAMKNALANIVLVVVIGVLNLPIYVPALAFSLDVSYDMNHEFFGQGAANLLAGLTGTVPNILVSVNFLSIVNPPIAIFILGLLYSRPRWSIRGSHRYNTHFRSVCYLGSPSTICSDDPSVVSGPLSWVRVDGYRSLGICSNVGAS